MIILNTNANASKQAKASSAESRRRRGIALRSLSAVLILSGLPTLAPAQVSSVFGRTGSVVAQSGDYSASQVTNAAATNATNTFNSYQVVCLATASGCPSPRVGVAYDAIGQYSGGENNLFDGVAYNGTSQFVAERYSSTAGGVGANLGVGGFYGAAQTSTGSDPADAGLSFYTTEAQTSTHNGMGLELDYTANATTALMRGISVSPQGNGGVTIGGGAATIPYSYSSPTDLGTGTLHVANKVETDNHFVSNIAKGTLSSCGTGGTVDRGGDNAGQITTGGSVTTCTYNFSQTWPYTPICIAQVEGRPTPTAYVNGATPTTLTVAFSAAYSGPFWFICMGITN